MSYSETREYRNAYYAANKDKWATSYRKRAYATATLNRINVSWRFTRGKSHSKRRNKEWSLTLEQFTAAVSLPCFYCADTLGCASDNVSTGLDRLDNTKGYTADNVVSCCKHCNSVRGDKLTVHETMVAIQAVMSVRHNLPFNIGTYHETH